mmetsp:Transcript_28696/g.80220  ORF Transcript_28696/g.80220 Transcript_28696/m.80220 type:complete len:230 (+) Transcript_28696:609-1298(+)
MPLILQVPYFVKLVLRERSCYNITNAALISDSLGRVLVITGQHPDLNIHALRSPHHQRCFWFYGIRNRNEGSNDTIHRGEKHRISIMLKTRHVLLHIIRQLYPMLLHEPPISHEYRHALTCPRYAHANTSTELLHDGRLRHFVRLTICGYRFRHGVLAVAFHGIEDGQNTRLRRGPLVRPITWRWRKNDGGHSRMTFCERSRFVKYDRCEVASGFDALPTLEQHAVLCT